MLRSPFMTIICASAGCNDLHYTFHTGHDVFSIPQTGPHQHTKDCTVGADKKTRRYTPNTVIGRDVPVPVEKNRIGITELIHKSLYRLLVFVDVYGDHTKGSVLQLLVQDLH